MAIPEDWIGKPVQIRLERADREIPGNLVEVNERGVVLTYALSNAPSRTLFYPWRVVLFIEVEPEQESPGDGTQIDRIH
jgi:hypothetical protein